MTERKPEVQHLKGGGAILVCTNDQPLRDIIAKVTQEAQQEEKKDGDTHE